MVNLQAKEATDVKAKFKIILICFFDIGGIIYKSRRMRWVGHVARLEEKRNAYRILVGMPEGKRPLGRTRRRWVDNIKTDLREIGWDGVD
jgi:hypothetical protein